jgi:hypothetical protein
MRGSERERDARYIWALSENFRRGGREERERNSIFDPDRIRGSNPEIGCTYEDRKQIMHRGFPWKITSSSQTSEGT